MPVIEDEEFGKITIRRSSAASQIKVRAAPDGTLHASIPVHAPMFLLKRLLRQSRTEIRAILEKAQPEYQFKDGMQIGKSHTLIIHETTGESFSVSSHGLQIVVKLPLNKNLQDPEISRKIRDAVITALRIEAKSYLPKRLSFLADKHGYQYTKARFSHASSRWGSCTSQGTISLNIALMKLPFELIDYVILHELSHTKEMNHSQRFWSLVASADPNYKLHRKILKTQNPSI